ncbi:MAG: cytochrome c biogenesis protein CcsA [Fimbriimonadaceae bacterium]|nr:cytochrome c biogenesis protein CcsA [Fimbriimonadaceae bacterium]
MEDLSLSLPEAPAWAMFAGVAGRVLVYATIVFFFASIIGWLRAPKSPGMERLGKVGFWLGACCLFLTFACLASLFQGNQFQYDYVFGHAESNLELKYKIAAIWSGQQGSFLLWAVCSAIFALIAAPRTGLYRRWFSIPYALFLAALGAILAYETPFNVIPEVIQNGKILVPPTGRGLVPALQNYWVVIHPPTIFLGFGSLTVLFCWSLSAMLNRNPIAWVRMVRPWAIASTAILGLGLMMGGFWAYETLGWGGFWAWDPVENVSFVPWVFGVALLHGLIIQSTKGTYIGANLVLGGLPFLFFVYGTFLTRSGFLGDSSVHSFAEMQRGALWVLMGLGLATLIGFLAVYLTSGRRLSREFSKPPNEGGANRESLYRTSNILLSLLAAATAIGMSMPFLSSLVSKRNVAIQEWLYHQVLSWVYVPLMILLAVTPFASWRSLGWKALWSKVFNVLTISVGLTGFALLYLRHPEWGLNADQDKTTLIAGALDVKTVYWVAFLIFLSLFATIGNIWRIVESLRRSPMSIGGFVSHLGIAVFMAGMILSRGLERHERFNVTRSSPDEKMGFSVTLKEDPKPEQLFDRNHKMSFDVTGPDGTFVARPGLYYTEGPDGPKPMVWPHIQRYGTHDVYLAMGPPAMAFWENPEFFKPGERRTIQDVTVTFHGYDMVGQPGTAGTKFVGKVTVEYRGEQFEANPTFAIGEPGTMPVTGQFRVALSKIDAATQGAELQLYFREAVYPIEIYYKPMTGLVWAGAGILALGGFLAAFYRRTKPTKPGQTGELDSIQNSDSENEVPNDNAPAPIA